MKLEDTVIKLIDEYDWKFISLVDLEAYKGDEVELNHKSEKEVDIICPKTHEVLIKAVKK